MIPLALAAPLALVSSPQDPFGPATILTPGLPVATGFAVADLDHDGRPDAVVSTGAGLHFVADLTGPVNGAPVRVDLSVPAAGPVGIGDVDGDGEDDVVTTFLSGSAWAVRWYTTGDLAASFTLRGESALTTRLLDLVVHDVDGDGDGDLVGSSGSGAAIGVRWVENLGGTFAATAQPLHPGPVHDAPLPRTGRTGFDFMDVDGDGALDLVIATTVSQRVRVLPGLAGGGFGAEVVVPGPFGAPDRTVLADMDSDGDLDALAFAGNQVVVRRNLGGFSFSGPSPVGPVAPFIVLQGTAPEDLDADGLDDLVVVQSATGGPPYGLAWFRGLGGGTFAAPAVIAPIVSDLLDSVRADVDADGLTDSVYTEDGLWRRSGALDLGLPDLTGPLRLDTPGPALVGAASGDFDGDGDRDVVASEAGAADRFWRWGADGAGEFAAPQPVAVTAAVGALGTWLGLDAGELDGDGRDEVLAWTDAGRIHGAILEQVGGAFVEAAVQPLVVAGSARNSLRAPRLEDLDGDGELDVLGWPFASALSPTSTGLVVQWNGGPAGPWTATEFPGVDAATGADLDGDGTRDLVAARALPGGGTAVSWYPGLGSATFGPPVDLATGVGTTDIAVADLTGDGLPDVVVSGPPAVGGAPDELLLLERLAGGTPAFAPARTLLDHAGYRLTSAPVVRDVDGDGRTDVLAMTLGLGAPEGEGLYLWRGDGAGALAAPEFLAARGYGVRFEAEDVDDDGDLDVLQWGPTTPEAASVLVLRAGTLRPAAGTAVCGPAAQNSTGVPARMLAFGHVTPTSTDLELRTVGLPPHVLGIYAASGTLGPPFPLLGSSGSLCLRGSIGRYDGPAQILDAGPGGEFRLALDPGAIEQPNGPVPAQAGETWAFQAWYRDVVGGAATSNLSDALVLEF